MSIGPENWCWFDHVIALRRERLGIADREAYSAAEQAAEDTGCTDAGQRCQVCGDPVTWTDHTLPPDGRVRCYAGVAQHMPSNVYPLKTRGGH